MTDKMDPQDYFDYIKERKNKCSDEFLTNFYTVVEEQLKKAVMIGQDAMVRKLDFALKVTEKEHELLKRGIDTFVYSEDIEAYIQSVDNKVVKIIDLEFYPRTIPDEIAEVVASLKEDKIFDNFYVVFTDYTGEVEKKVSKVNRKKDPIIFGTFEQKINGIWNIHDRFYYIGDWEDEYCDLTLSKMVDAMSKKGKDITRSVIKLPTTESIRDYVAALEGNDKDPNQFILRPIKQSYFKKVTTAAKSLGKAIIGG